MNRRFNFTNRVRIRRKDVRIIVREEAGHLAFDADLSSLGDYELPPESRVFIEAYRQANWMRFGFGQVGAISPAKNRYLTQFDSPDGVKFRVKVTPNGDIHSLLAEADAIPLVLPEQKDAERTPLLPVKPQKLGDEIYRLDFSGQDGRPLLLINSEAGNYTNIGKSPIFISLVYPAVLREILIRILLVEEHDDDDNPHDWKSQWVKFASLHPGLGELPALSEEDERGQWIEKAVSAFSKRIQVRSKFFRILEGRYMKIRKLTVQGIEQFSEYLDLLESEPSRLPPTYLLEDSQYSELAGTPTEIQKKVFGTRYAAAEYLYTILSRTGLVDLDRDIGLWAWLTLLYFDELCPKDRFGGRSTRERAAYIPEPQNFQRYYRHLLLGPHLIYRAHSDKPKRAMAVLCQPLHIIDDIIAQLAAYQEIVSNKSIIEMATRLYLDPVSGEKKKGAGGKGPGSPRRLTTVLDQFDVTWDLYAMSLSEFWKVLPKEFDKFRSETERPITAH